jgi:glutathione-independent formaldehyde dehydrogenase
VAGSKSGVYKGPGQVAVETIPYPSLEVKDGPGVNPAKVGRACPNGVILKVLHIICGAQMTGYRRRPA